MLLKIRPERVSALPRLRILPANSLQDASDAVSAHQLPRRTVVIACAAAVMLGLLVRLTFVISSDFPLNDGGLFYAMVRDLQASRYTLPDITTYNSSNIPFAYAPLSFYVAGFVADATGLGLVTVFRVLPLTASMLSMGAFALLARRILRDDYAFVTAIAVFALNPNGFEWLIMGGGLTRSFGYLFAILSLSQLHALFESKQRRYAVTGGLCAGLTALSHLEMAWFLAFSALLFLAFAGRTRRDLVSSVVAGAIAITVAAPWIAAVLAQHGPQPFLAAMGTSSASSAGPIIALIAFEPTGEALFSLMASMAVLGVVACVARRNYLLPVWLAAAALLDPRAFGTVATVPVAMLSGIAVAEVLLPIMLRPASLAHSESRPALLTKPPALLPFCALALAVCYATLSALIVAPDLMKGMTADERAAMRWVAINTPADSAFAVVTNDEWAVDRTSEWFPVIAQRQSVATVQGFEWVGGGGFARRSDAYRDLQKCADADASCLGQWSESSGLKFDYVYLPKLAPHNTSPDGNEFECCAALRTALRTDAGYKQVYDGPSATVFARTPGT